MSTLASVPVCDSDGVIIERADQSRARRLALAPNATVVRESKRKGGAIVRILLASQPDDYLELAIRGNPRKYFHKHETETNIQNVWTLKRIPTSCADIFGAVVNDLAA